MYRSHSKWIHLLVVAGLLCLLAGGYIWATWRFFTIPLPGGNDFMAHYSTWKAYFDFGYDPYSDETALYTQQLIYGRPAHQGEDQNRLTYPFYSLIFHAPFIVIDYPLARAIYMTLLQAALILGVWLNLDVISWHPQKWMMTLLIIWTLIFYPQARGIILGQFAIFGYFSLVACLYFLKRNRDFLAGMILVISTIKPTLVFMVIPFLLCYTILKKRFKFLAGFFATLLLLVAGSFLLLPTWLNEWILRISRYGDYTVGQSPVWLISNAFGRFSQSGEVLMVILLLFFLLLLWRSVFLLGGDRHFYWVLAMTLVVSNLTVPRSATTNYVMLLVAALLIFADLDRSGVWGRAVLIIVMFASIIGYWQLHFATVIGNQEQAIMFLPYPILVGLVLLVSRRWVKRDVVHFSQTP